MVEALTDCKRELYDNYCDCCIAYINDNGTYKNKVNYKTEFMNFRERSDWLHLIGVNILKAVYLVYGNKDVLSAEIISDLTPEKIHVFQFERLIKPLFQVVVLSAFPFFILKRV